MAKVNHNLVLQLIEISAINQRTEENCEESCKGREEDISVEGEKRIKGEEDFEEAFNWC